MEAIKLSVPQPVSLPAKTSAVTVKDQGMFASLLESLSAEAELPGEEQASAEELLEDLLLSLQELPSSEQLPESENLQYAVFQLAELQAKAEKSHLPAIISTDASGETAADGNEKLIGLLEKIQQKLQVLSNEFMAKPMNSPELSGTEEKNPGISVNSLAKVSKQLDELIGMLEKQQQPMMPVQQSKATGLEPIALSPVEGMKPMKNISEIPGTPQNVEAKEPQSAIKHQSGEELQPTKLPAESKISQETAVQPSPTAAMEAGKTAATIVRPETNPPTTPIVRLANLLEDLGGMLKSSMRLAETSEGMKMRVNIFPEHLGHLEILLTSTNGKLAAQIMASTPMAKEAIELQLNQLRASLVQQGVVVEKIEVLQQSSQQPFSQQHSQAEQRFVQSQQGKSSAQDKNGYFKAEDNPVAEQKRPLGEGLMKVDYTV